MSAGRDINIGHLGDVINQTSPAAYAGKLEAEEPKKAKLGANVPRLMQLGVSGTNFLWGGPPGAPFMTFADDYSLTIDSIDGVLKVSTQVRTRKGELIAELIENEWKVARPPKTWDRNYNKTALEVKDETGNIVLQVRLLSDRIQIQGEWWMDETRGIRLVGTNPKEGGMFAIFGKNYRPENAQKIRPLFRYPSELHLGELAQR